MFLGDTRAWKALIYLTIWAISGLYIRNERNFPNDPPVWIGSVGTDVSEHVFHLLLTKGIVCLGDSMVGTSDMIVRRSRASEAAAMVEQDAKRYGYWIHLVYPPKLIESQPVSGGFGSGFGKSPEENKHKP